MLTELRVKGYRSLRALRVPMGRCTVVVGPNGCGKTNLYNALRLVAECAQGRLAETIAAEGGMPSLLWAGQRRTDPARIECGVQMDEWDYAVSVGMPGVKEASVFPKDPWIRKESFARIGPKGRKYAFLDRDGPAARVRDAHGEWQSYPYEILTFESALSQIRDPGRYPELSVLRDTVERWRFYHHFPTEASAPARHMQVGVSTPTLADDGRNLAAALTMILEIGDEDALLEFVDRAFPKARLGIEFDGQDRIAVSLRMPGLNRPLSARELSDGTLRYLCLLAALLPPRAPDFIALNEPETSLHPDLLPPLARLIAHAAKHTQVWVTTHSESLADDIASLTETTRVELELAEGETRIIGQGLLDSL